MPTAERGRSRVCGQGQANNGSVFGLHLAPAREALQSFIGSFEKLKRSGPTLFSIFTHIRILGAVQMQRTGFLACLLLTRRESVSEIARDFFCVVLRCVPDESRATRGGPVLPPCPCTGLSAPLSVWAGGWVTILSGHFALFAAGGTLLRARAHRAREKRTLGHGPGSRRGHDVLFSVP